METLRNFNVTDVRSLVNGESFSLSANGKTLKVKDIEKKRKYYHLTYNQEGQRKSIRRKFSFEKAIKLPVFLRTDLTKTQIPQTRIVKLSMLN